MSMPELVELLKHIQSDHSFCRNKNGRFVKYVDPKIDTRNWSCFAISFRTGSDEVVFHTQNECRDLSESLFERVMCWLDEENV